MTAAPSPNNRGDEMMSEDPIAALKAVAEEATGGEYRVSPLTPSRVDTDAGSISISWFTNVLENPNEIAERQAAFIALSRPATILSLIAEREAYRDTLRRIAEATPQNTNSETAARMASWTKAVAAGALDYTPTGDR